MRKMPKIILFSAAAFIGTGALLSGGALAAVGFDTASLSTANYDWHQTTRSLENESTSPHSRIIISSDCENVRIEQADNDAIELDYWTGNTQEIDVADESGVLTVGVDSKPMEGIIVDLPPVEADDVEDTTTVIRVPTSFAGEIEVHSDSGDIFAESTHGLAKMHLSTREGDIVAKGVSATKLDVTNEDGDILLSDVESEAFIATNCNGDISLGGVAAHDAEITDENGDVMLANLSLSRSLTCESVNGDISAQKLDIVDSDIDNVNGDIYLSYLGGETTHRISAHSNLGDIDTPSGGDTDATRTIDVDSHLGDIQINFTSK